MPWGRYRDAIKLNHIKHFTLLNTSGHSIYTLTSRREVPGGQIESSRPVSAQLTPLQPDTSTTQPEFEMLRSATAPLLDNGVIIGALHVVVDQSYLNSVFLEAIKAGIWDILVLLSLIMLACCFMYLILAKIAKDHAEAASRIDDLTNLPTRKALMEQLTKVLASSTGQSTKTAVNGHQNRPFSRAQ